MTHRDERHDERHTDDIDRASALEMLTTEGAINAVRAAAKPQQAPRADGTFEVTDCEDCGNEIGEQRLKVSVMNLLCIHCATRQERRR